jgi:hypothetical protein
MKNQYFGDVNDYRKYGLLRALQHDGQLSLAVAWMLTPDDGSSDGGFRTYLDRPRDWRDFDSELFDGLSSALVTSASRGVGMIEESGLLPGATFFSGVVPDERDARTRWGQQLEQAASGVDLVFLDPDNGLQIDSKPLGRKGSSKYAMWCEVEALWSAGSSVLVYQHFRRERRDPFAQRMMAELRDHTGAQLVEAFRTPHVLFVLAGQERHRTVLEDAIARRLPDWTGQIDPVSLA